MKSRFNNRTKLRLLALLAILLTAGCSQKDSVLEIADWAASGEMIPAAESAKYRTFFEKASESNDYCRQLAVTATGVGLTLQSGSSMTLPAATPCLSLTDNGRLVRLLPGSNATTDLGIVLDERQTWYEAPALTLTDTGTVAIAGRDTGLAANGLCVVDCGKYVYCYTGTTPVAVASEIHEPFNPPLPRDPGLLKVLFVGNSFNVDATAHLPGMLKANGTCRVFMGRVYHGGCTLPQYDDNYAADRFCSYRVWRPGDEDWNGDEEYDTNLKAAVEAEDWDVVTFMEYTGNSCCWSWTEEEKEHINSLIQRVFAAHPQKRPTILFMLTQTFAAGSDLVATYFHSDQMEMYRTITGFAQQVVDDTCIDDIISTGTCIQNLRTSSLNDDPEQDLSRDGYHLDYGVSRYAAACTVFYTIFEPSLGLDLSDNSYRYDVKLDHTTAHSIPVTDDNVEICRYAARAAADHPLTLTDMSSY